MSEYDLFINNTIPNMILNKIFYISSINFIKENVIYSKVIFNIKFNR